MAIKRGMDNNISFSFVSNAEPLTADTRNLALNGSNFDFRCVCGNFYQAKYKSGCMRLRMIFKG